MRLFIAEKPSLARAIADVLPQPHVNKGDHILCGTDDVVAWCAGHILELASPDEYDPEWKQWRLDHLPICPRTWKLSVTKPQLLKSLKALLPRASLVVHAGDPDREGQLLVDEVLDFLAYRGRVQRILVSDLNPPAVRKALAGLKPNEDFRRLYDSARARQRADWLYGLNMTRLYTLLGRAGGYDGVLSVGRVQTPLLGLIVRRDLEIESFQPKPFYVVTGRFASQGGTFAAIWRPGERSAAFLDDEDRLVSREHAESIARAARGKAGQVTKCSREKKSEPPPLPYSLADLQIDAGRRLGLSAKDVLDACQSLYETHKLTTYPRSDCSYLPEGHLAEAKHVLAAAVANAPGLAELGRRADVTVRSRAWNDSKVTAHHAIIPTPNVRPDAGLADRERAVYELIARRYLAQFFPAFEYNQTQLEVAVEGETFATSGRQPLSQGWRQVLVPEPANDADEDGEGVDTRALPLLSEGSSVTTDDVTVADRMTKPPKRFTDGALIQAMTGISRFVSDPNIKQLLRETDGIGTEATRASIIETLFERGYVERKGKNVLSTQTGRALIQTLPAVATTPDQTALWEAAMRRILDGAMNLDGFLDGVIRQLDNLMTQGKGIGRLALPGAKPCPSPGCSGFLRMRKGERGPFWACSAYPGCKFTAEAGGATTRKSRKTPSARSQRRSA